MNDLEEGDMVETDGGAVGRVEELYAGTNREPAQVCIDLAYASTKVWVRTDRVNRKEAA